MLPVLIRKYNIPNSYVKRELFEVIYSFQIDYFSCRYFQTIKFNVWFILSMPQSGTESVGFFPWALLALFKFEQFSNIYFSHGYTFLVFYPD